MFNDTITLYKYKNGEYERIIIDCVQWTEKTEKSNVNGFIIINHYISVTFPERVCSLIDNSIDENTAIFYGVVMEKVNNEKGHRLSDLLCRHRQSGRIKAVNDNSKRLFLKNKRIILA